MRSGNLSDEPITIVTYHESYQYVSRVIEGPGRGTIDTPSRGSEKNRRPKRRMIWFRRKVLTSIHRPTDVHLPQVSRIPATVCLSRLECTGDNSRGTGMVKDNSDARK